MTLFARLAATAALAVAAAPIIAGEMTPVEWSQLPDPSAQEFEDPYRDLAPEQMSNLMSLVRLREELGGEGLITEESRQLEARTAKLEAALQAAGVDVEWLLSQRWVVAERRRQAAVAANRTLDGQSVEIAGFLILAPPTESGEASAYLLPDRGVCNHLPPPPPNQLVRLLMKDVPEIGASCVPAVVRGTLRGEETRHEVIVIDHSLPMWSAWTLEAEEIRAVRSATSGGGGALQKGAVATGLGWFRPESRDLAGLGVAWADPSEGFGDVLEQWTVEALYRWMIARVLALTIELQWIIDPALNPDEDQLVVFGLRLRMAL